MEVHLIDRQTVHGGFGCGQLRVDRDRVGAGLFGDVQPVHDLDDLRETDVRMGVPACTLMILVPVGMMVVMRRAVIVSVAMVVVFTTLAMVMLIAGRRVGVIVDVHTVLADPVHTDVDMSAGDHTWD